MKTAPPVKKAQAVRNKNQSKKTGFSCCALGACPWQLLRQRRMRVPPRRQAAPPRALSVAARVRHHQIQQPQIRWHRLSLVGSWRALLTRTFQVPCATMPAPLICMSWLGSSYIAFRTGPEGKHRSTSSRDRTVARARSVILRCSVFIPGAPLANATRLPTSKAISADTSPSESRALRRAPSSALPRAVQNPRTGITSCARRSFAALPANLPVHHGAAADPGSGKTGFVRKILRGTKDDECRDRSACQGQAVLFLSMGDVHSRAGPTSGRDGICLHNSIRPLAGPLGLRLGNRESRAIDRYGPWIQFSLP